MNRYRIPTIYFLSEMSNKEKKKKGRNCKMLRTDLPKIITETLPGPKAQAIIDRRADVVPDAIRCVYPVVIAKGEGAMLEEVCRLHSARLPR